MNRDIPALTSFYANKGIFVDSNLLLLYFVGAIDKDLIQRFKRTKQYALEDYNTLEEYIGHFSQCVTTPNVLTEVSNLANSLTGDLRVSFWHVLKSSVTIIREDYVPSGSVLPFRDCVKFGLTDVGITTLVKGKYLLLTDDFPLSQYFQSIGGDVVNFNHMRIIGWS
jgi:hypothetical protein